MNISVIPYQNDKKTYSYFLEENQKLVERIISTISQRVTFLRWITCPVCLCQHRFVKNHYHDFRFGICPDCEEDILEKYKQKLYKRIECYCFRTKIWIYLKEQIIEKSYEPHRILQTGRITSWS
jgi:hypothetical protein